MNSRIPAEHALAPAGIEYLRHIRALDEARSLAHDYLASIWLHLVDQPSTASEGAGGFDWQLTASTDRDLRSADTAASDPSATVGIKLAPRGVPFGMPPAVSRLVLDYLRVEASDGRKPRRTKGHVVLVEAYINNKDDYRRFRNAVGDGRLRVLAQRIRDLGPAWSPADEAPYLFSLEVPLGFTRLFDDVEAVRAATRAVTGEAERFLGGLREDGEA